MSNKLILREGENKTNGFAILHAYKHSEDSSFESSVVILELV